MASLDFMEIPLVNWVESFNDGNSLEFKDLYDGVYLNDVMLKIDPRPTNYDGVNRAVEDANIRLQNWEILMKNVKAFYSEVLQQLLILKMPNVHTICREPEKDVSLTEMRKALLLILGCAVQCERKGYFIDVIKNMDVAVQQDIVEHIKEVTDDWECILPLEPGDQLELYTEKTLNHLKRVLSERDNLAEVSIELAQERDYYQAQMQSKIKGSQVLATPPTTPEKHHLVVELAESKAKIRRLRQDLEEKQESLTELQEEIDDKDAIVNKLKAENLELKQEARMVRTLNDELDVLREKLSKADGNQNMIVKYKEKLNELEFYKTRLEDLREENGILHDTKKMLEEELSTLHKRVETVVTLEKELLKKKHVIEEMTQERQSDGDKIRILTEENAQLQFEKKSNMNESTSLELELESARLRTAGMHGTLSDQLNETTNAKVLRLELENKRLSQRLEEMKENAIIENAALTIELEKENQRLAKKVEKLQEESQDSNERIFRLEQCTEQLEKEKEQITQRMEKVKENSDRQVKELERENDNLSHTVEVIRARNEQTNDARLKDLERENKRLSDQVAQKDQVVSKVEYENRQLQKSYNKLKHNCDKISELETENSNLDKENLELHKTISTLKLTCNKFEKLEQENSDLEVENRKLHKTVDTLQSQLQKREALEQEHINLSVENQKLQRTIDNMKNSTSKIAEVENEKDSLNREIQQLKRTIDGQKNLQMKLEQMELDLMDLDNENVKLQKSLEITTNRVKQLEKDNSDLENENEKLQKLIDKMKISNKRLDDIEKQNSEMENEVSALRREKSVMEKDLKRLKHSLEIREASLDDISAKHSALEKEHRTLKHSVNSHKETNTRIRELEKENRQLFQETTMHKKTVSTLREDLVNEKIKSQQVNNDLDKLTHDLEKVGINKEKLAHIDLSQDDSRYKALESMMEETLKRSMQIKEEKIQSLESRLEESKNRNMRLQEELRSLKRECESLKQRFEEETMEKQESTLLKSSNPSSRGSNSAGNWDRLVQVERTNATMAVENSNLKAQTNALNEQIKKLENQNTQLQSQTHSLQQHGNSLQSQNAKLQVENSTLQSQCSSFKSQNSSLQDNINRLNTEHQHLIHTHEELQSSHEQLLQDHESLQSIHEKLSSDYEAVISEHGSLKSVHKSIKRENKELHEQLTKYLHGRDNIHMLHDQMNREKDMMQNEIHSLRSLQEDNNRCREENNQLTAKNNNLRLELRDVNGELKRVKSDNNALQGRNTELMGQCGEYKEQLHAMEIEINSLAHKYDTQYQMNQKMEEENSNLLLQIKALINSNQELLAKIINNKEHFVEEEKSYMEKLNDLNRQKERLEEKIMDYYTRKENHKKNRGLGARIARKAAKIFVSKNQRSKSRTNLTDLSADNTSQGSGSVGETTDADLSRKSARHNSMWNLSAESGGLSKQHRSLAKSTTALDSSKEEDDTPPLSGRGTKSTEDLLAESNTTERDSLSFLPGMGRPASLLDDDEDDGGFGNTKESSNQMMTLEEFLNEAAKSSPPKIKQNENRSQEDTESKSSENSDNSASRQYLRKRAPQPPVHTPSNGGPRISSSIPDVAAVSHLDLSRMSHISTGSGGSGHDSRRDDRSTSPHHWQTFAPPETSTPAQSHNAGYKNDSYPDSNSSYKVGPHNFRQQSLGSTPSTASRTLQYSFNNSPQSQNNSVRSPLSRELPPTPGESRLNPSDRLDRLMATPSNNTSQNSKINNSVSSGRDSYDSSVQSGNLSDKPPHPRNFPSSQGGRPFMRVQNQNQSPSWVKSPQSSQQMTSSHNGPYSDSPVNHNQPLNNRSVNNNVNPRRLSMIDSSASQQNIYSSIDELKNRNNNNNENSPQSNGPTRNSYGNSPEQHYARVQKIERPKSVPPNMFNQLNQQQGNVPPQDYTYSQPQKSTPPVPPPRRAGRVVREPSQANRQILASRSSTNQQSPSGRQLPSGELTRSQTPNFRIGPAPKPVQTISPPEPKPLPNEPKDPKENSTWYEYGCV